jgi:hypothetical protein
MQLCSGFELSLAGNRFVPPQPLPRDRRKDTSRGRGSRSSHPSLLPEARSAWPRWTRKRFSDSYYLVRSQGPQRVSPSATKTFKVALRSYGDLRQVPQRNRGPMGNRIRGVSTHGKFPRYFIFLHQTCRPLARSLLMRARHPLPRSRTLPPARRSSPTPRPAPPRRLPHPIANVQRP